MRVFAFCFGLLFCQTAFCREIVHLTSGFSVEADSHTDEADFVTVKVGDGTMLFAKADIREIQPLPDAIAGKTSSTSQTITASPEQVLIAAARAQGLPEAFVQSVARVESGLRQNAISPKGAIGLMQLMPGTAAILKVDPRAADANASGGAAYLRQLLLQYRGDSGLALAAYNAGPGAVKKFGGVPPFAETRHYILKVLAEYKRQLSLAQINIGAPSLSASKLAR